MGEFCFLVGDGFVSGGIDGGVLVGRFGAARLPCALEKNLSGIHIWTSHGECMGHEREVFSCLSPRSASYTLKIVDFFFLFLLFCVGLVLFLFLRLISSSIVQRFLFFVCVLHFNQTNRVLVTLSSQRESKQSKRE